MNLFHRNLFAVSLLAGVVTAGAQNRVFTNQYSFGDSLSDSGNIHAATGALGAATPPAPYYQGRYSNGPTFVEQLGQTMALTATAAPSVKSSLNFAFGGATAGGSSQLPPSLAVQIGMFQQRGITPAATDLFTVLAGANDLISTLSAPTTPSNPASLDVAGAGAAQAVAANVQTLVRLGAKNLVVAGLPNLGATPRSLAAGGAGGTGAAFGLRATTAFNHELRARLQTIAAAAPDVNLVYLDLQSVLDRMIADYRTFGFANATAYYLAPAAQGGGAGDPNSYVFWDDIHPTARSHALLAAVVTEQLNPEVPLGVAGALGSASLALQGLATRALDARTSQLAFSPRPVGRADAFASFNYGDGGRAREGWRPKFDYQAHVITAGLDRRMSERFLGGAAVDLGRLHATLKGAGGEFTVEDGTARLYGVWRGGPVSLVADVDYGSLSVKDLRRTTAFGGLAARGKTGGSHWGVGVKTVWAADCGGHTVRPWLGLQTQRVKLEGFTEKDVPALAMEYAAQDAKSTSGAAGVDAALAWKVAGLSTRLDLRAAWHGEISSWTRNLAGRLANNFTRLSSIELEDGDGSGVELGGAATVYFASNWSVSLGYAADIRPSEKLASRASLSVQTGF